MAAWLLWLIPLPPLFAFFLIIFFAHRNNAWSHSLAVAAATLSWLGSMFLFARALATEHLGQHPLESAINWIPTGEASLQIGVRLDPLTAVALFFVAWTVLAIFVYSIGYHNFGQPKGSRDAAGLPPQGATIEEHGRTHVVPSVEPMYARFFAFISLFAFGMYLLVVSDNLLTLFIGWEIMGLCSYLLIGFWYGKPSARDAAVKAFMTTRIGDMFLLLGLAWLYAETGSLSYRVVFAEETLHRLATVPVPLFGLSIAGGIGILFFLGTVGKSAQWPLHVWLPDAMEGPTPVSAMIHAATMVSAGVYLALRMFPILRLDARALAVVAFLGAFTALFAATIALAQNDMKRVLAYSTISQLGYMVAAVGVGAYVAAAFHLVTHAFFKALLFLGAGSVIHGMEHGALHSGDHANPQDMFQMGGLRRRMPVTFWTFLTGGFALAGFPLVTAGFWSKDEILSEAYGHGHLAVFLTLAIAAFLTAFYTMRQITLTFLGQPRTKAAEHAHETPWMMTIPLVVLGFFAVTLGWVGIPEHFPVLGGLLPNWFHEFVGGSLAETSEAAPFSWIPLVVSLSVSLGGLLLGWLVYRNVKTPAQDFLQIPLLKNRWYFDELYHVLFVRPAAWVAERLVYLFVDRAILDGILHLAARGSLLLGHAFRTYFDAPVVNGLIGDGAGAVVKASGATLRRVQSGQVQSYMMISLSMFFFIAILYLFIRSLF